MVTEERSTQEWGPRPGEDWRAHRMRVFADYPDMLAVLRVAESREHESEIWREWHIASCEGDPQMQEMARKATYDLEAPPEEDEDDFRYVRNNNGGPDEERLLEFWRWFGSRFPDWIDGSVAGG